MSSRRGGGESTRVVVVIVVAVLWAVVGRPSSVVSRHGNGCIGSAAAVKTAHELVRDGNIRGSVSLLLSSVVVVVVAAVLVAAPPR